MKKLTKQGHSFRRCKAIFISSIFFTGIMVFAFEAFGHIGACPFSEAKVSIGWRFTHDTAIQYGVCVNGVQTGTYRKMYKNDAQRLTCHISKTTTRSCSSTDTSDNGDSDLLAVGMSYNLLKVKQISAVESQRLRAIQDLEDSVPLDPDMERASKMIEDSYDEDGNYNCYKPSDLPVWDFDFSVQASHRENETELTPVLGRKSDVKTIGVRLAGTKENFHIKSRLLYSSFIGTDDSDGQDTESFSIALMPGFKILNHRENWINLSLFGLLEFSSNDYGDAGSDDRYIGGVGCSLSKRTPIGGFQLAYMFSHDRNSSGDEEITGDDFLNFHTGYLKYYLPLTRSFLFSTRLSYLWIMDMPDDMENSSTEINVALGYSGWKNFSVSLSYDYSIDGYESQGINLSIGYRW